MRRSECAFPTKEKKELRAKPTNAYSRAGKMLHMLLFTAQKPNMIKFVRISFLQSPFWRKWRKKCWEMCCFFRGMLRWTRYVQKNNIQRFTCLVPGIRWMNLFEILFECVWEMLDLKLRSVWQATALCENYRAVRARRIFAWVFLQISKDRFRIL